MAYTLLDSSITDQRNSCAAGRRRRREDAVGPAAEIHDQMPIALPKDAEGEWLDKGLTDATKAIDFASLRAVIDLVHHPVNPRVNSGKVEGADLVEPVKNPA